MKTKIWISIALIIIGTCLSIVHLCKHESPASGMVILCLAFVLLNVKTNHD